MKLSPLQYRDIMQEYDRTRQENLSREITRREEIHRLIPRIRGIDEEIARRKAAAARYRLFHYRQNTNDNPDAPGRGETDIADLLQQKKVLLLRHRYPEDYLDPIYTCKRCRDTGYRGKDKCSCFLDKIRGLYIRQSNLSDFMAQDNFQSFETAYYSPEPMTGQKLSPRDNILRVLTQSRHFIETFRKSPGQNLLVYGSAGVGKTFLTHCIGAELLNRDCPVLYLSASRLFSRLADYTFHREDYHGKSPEEIFDVDLLIIDDLGTELTNGFINSQLFICLNERILRKKSTVISTNLSLKQISASYTERIFSRIVESYTLLHIYGNDIRLQKAFSS